MNSLDVEDVHDDLNHRLRGSAAIAFVRFTRIRLYLSEYLCNCQMQHVAEVKVYRRLLVFDVLPHDAFVKDAKDPIPLVFQKFRQPRLV